MNLLSQENSAKEDNNKKVQKMSRAKKDTTINLDDIEEIKVETSKTPTHHLDFMNDDKME